MSPLDRGWRSDGQEGVRVDGRECNPNKLQSRHSGRQEAALQRELGKKGIVLPMIDIAEGKLFAKSMWPSSRARGCPGK